MVASSVHEGECPDFSLTPLGPTVDEGFRA